MCGICGVIGLDGGPVRGLGRRLGVMNDLMAHRGPDGHGIWTADTQRMGFGHRRLSIIDLASGDQPMTGDDGDCIVLNGEIYNYIELREELGYPEGFRTHSDTEVVLKAYQRWGESCVERLRGMFAFAIWDARNGYVFCARDRFGIKPFYYTQNDGILYFASEIKALLPFAREIETNVEGLRDYLTFQFCLAGKTLFNGITELLPAHAMRIDKKGVSVYRYWEVYYNLDFNHTSKYFEEKLRELVVDSVRVHMRADVPIGGYVSGGLDSTIVSSIAAEEYPSAYIGFTGKFTYGQGYDESQYARALADWRGFELQELDITVDDFVKNIEDVIYHLDYPVAGPGVFPQFMVSRLASKSRKVVLGGQGGDEIFGGYTRYLIAYFEQVIKAAIDGTMSNGNFVVTYESIILNLVSLRNYKPLLQEFWSKGLFEDLDKRYFRLINRAPSLGDEIRWDRLGDYDPFRDFELIFMAQNVKKESYFDSMTHFDFKTLLPALLQVEDRMSMASGIESRVPFLDHPLVELAATIPADIKFKDGTMKQVLKKALGQYVPPAILDRKDKMGFPVPLNEWMKGEARDFIVDIFSSQRASQREFVNNGKVAASIEKESKFGRNIWGLLSLELWHRQFHDQRARFRGLAKNAE